MRPRRIGEVRHRHRLSDPNVQAWYEERGLRSKQSAEVYLRGLGRSCDVLGLGPEEIATLARKKPDTLRVLLVRFAAHRKSEGRLDSSTGKHFDILKAWFRFRGVAHDVFPKLSPSHAVSLENERVPTPEELRRVLYSGMSLRGRSIGLFMAHAGLRPGVLGAYKATDGLRLMDLSDLRLSKTPCFREVPFRIRVPARLSKIRKAYTTFGSRELADSFEAYLQERTSGGEDLCQESPVIAAHPMGIKRGWAKPTGFLTTTGVTVELHHALAAAAPQGIRWRPYVLRGYCSTRLLMAEGNGRMTRDLREAILGHDGGIAARYHLGKPWGEELLKEARSAYKRAQPYLSTSSALQDSQDGVLRALRLLLQAKGIASEKIDKLDLVGKTEEEIVAVLKTVGVALGPETRAEKAVPMADVAKLLDAGWEFVSPLNGAMAILRAPAAVGESTSPKNSGEFSMNS